jgi:hypothetical protein
MIRSRSPMGTSGEKQVIATAVHYGKQGKLRQLRALLYRFRLRLVVLTGQDGEDDIGADRVVEMWPEYRLLPRHQGHNDRPRLISPQTGGRRRNALPVAFLPPARTPADPNASRGSVSQGAGLLFQDSQIMPRIVDVLVAAEMPPVHADDPIVEYHHDPVGVGTYRNVFPTATALTLYRLRSNPIRSCDETRATLS